MKKICNSCKKSKKLQEFSKDTSAKDNHSYICKKCNKQKCKIWYLRNKNKIVAYRKKYRNKILNYHKEYRQTHKKYFITYRNINRKKIIAKSKKYYQENKKK